MWNRLVAAGAAAFWMGSMATSLTSAAVNLELRPSATEITRFAPLDVTLYAVWDGNGPTDFIAVNAAISWDPQILRLSGPAKPAGNHSWGTLGIFGFELDQQRDRLNEDCGDDLYCPVFTESPFNDGDAFFQALSFTPETATTVGVAIATFSFTAVSDAASTEIRLEDVLGVRSFTEVLASGAVDVSGVWSGTSVSVQTDAVLITHDVSVVAGRTSEIIVSAEVLDQDVYAVEVLLELAPRAGALGTVAFTPQFDIEEIDDPWPGAGDFSTFEEDQTFSPTLNGSSEDNGTFLPGPLTYSGDLSAFPISVSADATGSWDLRLRTSVGDSSWFPSTVKTGTRQGILRVVELGDGDGSETIDVGDFADFQVCYTGDVGPADPPMYPWNPDLHCSIYDFNDDGDVDADDYAAFSDVMMGLAP